MRTMITVTTPTLTIAIKIMLIVMILVIVIHVVWCATWLLYSCSLLFNSCYGDQINPKTLHYQQWRQLNLVIIVAALQWRHNEHDSVSNHQPHVCLLNRLFGRRSKKTSKLCVTGLCVGNSPGTDEFPAQMASNAEMFPFDDVIMRFEWYCLYHGVSVGIVFLRPVSL